MPNLQPIPVSSATIRTKFRKSPELKVALWLLFVGILAAAILIRNEHIARGDSFEFHKSVRFRILIGTNAVLLTGDQSGRIFRDLKYKMPPNVSLRIDHSSFLEGRQLAIIIKGTVTVSTNTQPGIQEIRLLLPGLEAVAKSLGATVVFSDREGHNLNSNGIQLLEFKVHP